MISIRPATENDIPDLARIHIEGWKAAYGGMVDQQYLDSLSVKDRMEDWARWMAEGSFPVLLAHQEGQPAGFISIGRMRTAPPGTSPIRPLYTGEIYALYLFPDVWRQGIGRALMIEACLQLRAQKHNSMCLWVLDKNDRAKSFYEVLGGQRVGKHMVEIGPSKVKEICYGWRDLTAIASE